MRRTTGIVLCIAIITFNVSAQSYKVHTSRGESHWIIETDSMRLTTEGKEKLLLKASGFCRIGDPRNKFIIVNLVSTNGDTAAPFLHKKESEVRFLLNSESMNLRVKSYNSKRSEKASTEYISLIAEFGHIERLAKATLVAGYWGNTKFTLNDEVMRTLRIWVEVIKEAERLRL